MGLVLDFHAPVLDLLDFLLRCHHAAPVTDFVNAQRRGTAGNCNIAARLNRKYRVQNLGSTEHGARETMETIWFAVDIGGNVRRSDFRGVPSALALSNWPFQKCARTPRTHNAVLPPESMCSRLRRGLPDGGADAHSASIT